MPYECETKKTNPINLFEFMVNCHDDIKIKPYQVRMLEMRKGKSFKCCVAGLACGAVDSLRFNRLDIFSNLLKIGFPTYLMGGEESSSFSMHSRDIYCTEDKFKTLVDSFNNAGINASIAATNLRKLVGMNLFKEYPSPKNPTAEDIIKKKKNHKPFYKSRMNLKKWER